LTAAVQPARLPRWIIDFVLLAAIWGSSFLFMRLALVEVGAMATAFWRVTVASAFLLPLALLRGHGADLRRSGWKVCVMGIFNSAIPFALFAFALGSITTGMSAILNATVPLMGALVAWLWLGDRPGASRALGLLIGFAGVALLALDKGSLLPAAPGSIAPGWAVLACLVATLCYGLAATATKKYLAGMPALVTATGSQLGAMLGLALPTLLVAPPVVPSLRVVGALLALGILCTGAAYILYFRLIEEAGPARALAVTFVVPAFAVLYGTLFLGETVPLWMLMCGVVIVLGTALSTGLLQRERG
jgi:drug/metabolite transporter (DMT)-like permease